MKTPAPNFNGSYPLAGDRIGPAWVTLWHFLSTGTPQCGYALASLVTKENDLKISTVLGLLRRAVKVGILEQKRISCPYHEHRRQALGYRVLRK
jgi:hypothetical protein